MPDQLAGGRLDRRHFIAWREAAAGLRGADYPALGGDEVAGLQILGSAAPSASTTLPPN